MCSMHEADAASRKRNRRRSSARGAHLGEAVGDRSGERVSSRGGPGSGARKLVDAREELILRGRADKTYPGPLYHDAACDVHARAPKKTRYR
eukprot:1365861-Pleurochrysis_carterae.AAC.3